uniref:Ig-like domain-containing protein n=2 Tax=Pseudonaja textilis TaxID=8673 RepID=A0A670ZAJ0_PSETE
MKYLLQGLAEPVIFKFLSKAINPLGVQIRLGHLLLRLRKIFLCVPPRLHSLFALNPGLFQVRPKWEPALVMVLFVHIDQDLWGEGRLVMGAFFPLNSREEMGVSVPVSRSLQGGRVYFQDSPNHFPVSISGFHIIQRMYGCELRKDGSKGGFDQYGYEGRTFLYFDKKTPTWVAPDPQAQITKRKWDGIPAKNQYWKSYLEKECIEWLQKHLSYGKETLLRTEPPGVTLVRGKTEVEDGMETHICRLDGFYPREIDASWKRDGEVWLEETFHGSLAPNADGTYHYWLSIRIDPKERGRYRCHVEHDGLQEPLDLAVEGERLQGGEGWALWQAGRWWERNLAPDVSRCEQT